MTLNENLPKAWIDIINSKPHTQKEKILSLWKNSCFPKINQYLQKNLKSIEIVKEKSEYKVIYTIYNQVLKHNRQYYGYIPKTNQTIPFQNSTLKNFYNTVSNGFTDMNDNFVGPQPISQIEPLSVYDWEILPSNYNTNNKIIILNSGGKSFFVLDNNKTHNDGILWHSDELPEENLDTIKTLDTWTLIGISDY